MRNLTLLFGLLLFLAGCGNKAAIQPTPSPVPTITSTPLIGVYLVTKAPPTPAIVQVTPSPLPTATPTPTPTPIFYAIADGDTLWDVAWLHQTTIDEILAMNPSLRPEVLQIGQPIQLPPPATPVYQAGSSTPIPLNVVVSSLAFYRTPVGGLWVVGEVENLGEVSAENIQLQIAMADESGTPLGTHTTWVAPGIIPAGTKAPFGRLLAEAPDTMPVPHRSTASVVGGNSVFALGSRYLDLQPSESSLISENEQLFIEGRVTNTGETESAFSLLYITLYDADGGVSGFAIQTISTPLPAGESTPFSVAISPPGGVPVTFSIVAQGTHKSE